MSNTPRVKRQRTESVALSELAPSERDLVVPTPTTRRLSSKSWLEIHTDVLECGKVAFKELWDCHPKEHGEVVVFGKTHKVPRWMALYGTGTYTFSGQTLPGNPEIPALVERCFEFAKLAYPGHTWNGALVNWYNDGNHYIGKHSDDERDLTPGAPILSFSFGGERIFRIAPRKSCTDGEKCDLPTKHASLIAMCGAMQREFTHEVPRTKKYVARRINVTIRSFRGTE